jgi:hypothetical protein
VRITARQFWLGDQMLVALLALLSFFIFGVPVLRLPHWAIQALHLLFSALVLSGTAVLSRGRIELLGGVALAGGALVVRAAEQLSVQVRLEALDALFSFAADGLLAYLMIRHIFRPGPVTSYRVVGAVAAYLLMGAMFFNLYMALGAASSTAFRFAQAPKDIPELTEKLIYFSISTLTTVGFGDISPVHPAARSAAVLEALVGQLFPAILIARVVAMQLETRRSGGVDKSDRP